MGGTWKGGSLKTGFCVLLCVLFTACALPQLDAEEVNTDQSSARGSGSLAAPRDSERRGEVARRACGEDELEPNDLREMATPYRIGTAVRGCLATTADVDFYEFSAPAADPSGGYFQLSFTDVGETNLVAQLFNTSDNASLLRAEAAARGNDLFVFFAAAPGQVYRVEVSQFFGGDTGRYTLSATYTGVDDPYEPNDTRETASPIAANVPVQGYLFGGYRSSKIVRADFSDWYLVQLEAGSVAVKVTSVAIDLLVELSLYNLGGKMIDEESGSDKGANTSLSAEVNGGSYLVRVGSFFAPDSAGEGKMPYDHFTRPYTFTVQQ